VCVCVRMRGTRTVLALKKFWLLKASFYMCHITSPQNGRDLQDLPQLSLIHPVNPLPPQPTMTEERDVLNRAHNGALWMMKIIFLSFDFHSTLNKDIREV